MAVSELERSTEIGSKRCSDCGRGGEWPGQPCPTCKADALEPIKLYALACHLRDQRWVDMYVSDDRGKLVKRVKLTSVIVRTTDELVSARQEWVDDPDGDEPVFRHQDLVFEAESIWRVVSPTNFTFEGATPYGVAPIRRKPMSETSERQVVRDKLSDVDAALMRTINHVLEAASGHPASLIGKYDASSNGNGVVFYRYQAMMLLYDMTQLSTHAITAAYGYASVMPMESARSDHTTFANAVKERRDRTEGCRQRLRELAADVDKLVPTHHRRQPAEARYVL